MTNFEIESELRQNLSGDEKLVWAGKPKTGIIFRTTDAFLIPFSLMWGGFAIFWESTVLVTNAPFFFKLWGIPFVLIGLYIIAGRFFVDAKKRANTIYGITQDRIIIKSGLFSRGITSLNIKTLADISIQVKSDNSGTITFGPYDSRNRMALGAGWPGAKQQSALEFIENAQTVYNQIIQLQRQK